MRGWLTYSVEVLAKRLKQSPIDVWAIVIATIHSNSVPLLPLVVVDPIGEVTMYEVEPWAGVGFGPFTKVHVEDVLWLLRCETISPVEGLTLRFARAILVVP